jgi:hypothetical protein
VEIKPEVDMKKIILVICSVIVIGVVGIVLGRNILARVAMEKGIKAVTGMDIEVKGVNIGLTGSVISIRGLKVYNPAGYGEKLMFDIPEVYVDIDLMGLLSNKVHIRDLKINIQQANVLLNDKGALNVNSLAVLIPKPGNGKPPEVKIDLLSCKVGKVGYKGAAAFVGEKSGEFALNLDESFHDVTDPQIAAKEILGKILKRVGAKGLENIEIKGIKLNDLGIKF